MLLMLGIGSLGGVQLFWLIFTHIELPEMVNGSLTAESIAKRTMTAQWFVRGGEFVGWILILIGFLKIKRPESPA